MLINFYGLRILTDPVLFNRIGVDLGIGSLGPQRLVQCALAPEALPEIDLVLVSHAHFDHLDTPSLAAVRGRPVAVMAAATADLLPRRHYSTVHELRWGDVGDGDDAARRRPGARDRSEALGCTHPARRPTAATAASSSSAKASGCSSAAIRPTRPAFAAHRRYGPFVAAVMPIGAYNPWIANHCTPEQAVTMADAAGARLFVPVHHRLVQP